MSSTRNGAFLHSSLCNDGLIASRRRLATPAFGAVGCEDNTVAYCTQRALALESATSVAGYHPIGGNVPCFGMSVARHDLFVVHAIDGDQLRCDNRATVTVQSLAHFPLPVVQYSMMNQLRDSEVRGVM